MFTSLSHREVQGMVMLQVVGAKAVITVQVCVSAFVREKPHDIFSAGSRYFNICKHCTTRYFQVDLGTISSRLWQQNWLFLTRRGDISSCICAGLNRYFGRNHNVFLILTKLVLSLILTTVYSKHSIVTRKQQKIEP